MALRYSTAVRNFMAGIGSYKDAFQNGRIEIYQGAQPATADAAVTGTLLCTITDNSQARTAEVLSAGSVTLTGGASGSVNTLTVNGIEVMGAAVPFNTSLTQTAADVAAQINRFHSGAEYLASAAGAVVTITALPGTGTMPNGFIVASTVTTLTKTDANMAGGVAAANGLKYDFPANGAIAKLASQVWSGLNVASGTAGYYRQYGSVADAGGADTNLVYYREDGAISTSGAEMNLSSTALTAGATTTLGGSSLTIPTL
ncbi:MAG TPA: hypothetical protein VIY48_08490 [Candidatus Paceibacterota bacterium]